MLRLVYWRGLGTFHGIFHRIQPSKIWLYYGYKKLISQKVGEGWRKSNENITNILPQSSTISYYIPLSHPISIFFRYIPLSHPISVWVAQALGLLSEAKNVDVITFNATMRACEVRASLRDDGFTAALLGGLHRGRYHGESNDICHGSWVPEAIWM